MNLSDNLKKIRKEHNLSQEQLAETLGVSRQAVSKWESAGAYPEMDKVLQLCQIFNVNIDDLLNQDIKEVNNNKQSKSNINKFIDDFLDYITKTIDMFSSMKFKEKIKCIIEQFLIIGIIILVALILGSICTGIIRNILMFLPDKIYFVIYHILEGIYLVFSLVLGIILLLHIFKVRYLDYYIIIKDDIKKEESKVDNTNEKENNSKESETKKLVLEKKKEKIIIRDPKHSEYKFISSLLKVLLFIIKSITALIAAIFCMTLITLVILLVISFLFIKTGLLFIGSIITSIAAIIMNIIILIILYNFIVSRKNKKEKLAVFFIISLLLIGIGIGMICIGISDFNVVAEISDSEFIQDTVTIQMEDNLFFETWGDTIEYVESDNSDIKIIYKHSKYYDIKMIEDRDGQNYFNFYPVYEDAMDIVRSQIKNINNKKIIDYSNFKIYIYTNKENIQRLRENRNNYYDNQHENEINNLYEIIEEKDSRINELEESIQDKNIKINELEEELENYNLNY